MRSMDGLLIALADDEKDQARLKEHVASMTGRLDAQVQEGGKFSNIGTE